MTNKKTDQLLDSLCNDLDPVKKTGCAYVRAAMITLAAIVCIAVGVIYFGVRQDIDHRMTNAGMFIFENILMLLAGTGAAITAIQLSVPRLKPNKSALIIGSLSALIWVGLIIYAFMSVSFQDIKEAANVLHLNPFSADYCVADLLVLGIFPGIMLFFMLHKAAPIKTGLSGGMMFLSAASFAAIGSRYLCSMDSWAHLLVWHFLPVIVMGLLGILIGKRFLKW